MAQYQIQDESGRSIVLEGDAPPTEQELEQIFATLESPEPQPRQFQDISESYGGVPGPSRVASIPEYGAEIAGVEQMQPQVQGLIDQRRAELPDMGLTIQGNRRPNRPGPELAQVMGEKFWEGVDAPIKDITGIIPRTTPAGMQESLINITEGFGGRRIPRTPGGVEPGVIPKLASGAVTGISETAEGMASFMESARGITEMALTKTPVAPAVMVNWAKGMIESGMVSSAEAIEAYKRGDWEEFARNSAIALGMFGGGTIATKHGVKSARQRWSPAVNRGVEAVQQLTPSGKLAAAERVEAAGWLAEHNNLTQTIERLEQEVQSNPAKQPALDRLRAQQQETGLSKAHQRILDAEMEDIGAPVEVVWGSPKRKAGQFMGINRESGAIEVYGETFPQWLESVATKRRSGAVRASLREEQAHLNTPPEAARAYWESLSDLEKGMIQKIYGAKPGEAGFTETDLGYEALRQRVERASGETPREFLEATLEDQLDMRALELMGNAVRGIRERLLKTRASQQGLAALDRVQQNIEAAKTVVEKMELTDPDWGSPAARNKKQRAAEEATASLFSKADTVGPSQIARMREALADPRKMAEIDELGREQAQARKQDAADGQSFPAAISKREAERIRAKQKMDDLRKAEREGTSIPAMQPPKPQPDFMPVESAERVGPVEAGALPRLTPEEFMAGEIKARKRSGKAKDATYAEFKEWIRESDPAIGEQAITELWRDPEWRSKYDEANASGPAKLGYTHPNFEDFQSVHPSKSGEELKQLWESAVDDAIYGKFYPKTGDRLGGASNERLAEWRKALGMEKNWGSGAVREKGVESLTREQRKDIEMTQQEFGMDKTDFASRMESAKQLKDRADQFENLEGGQEYAEKLRKRADKIASGKPTAGLPGHYIDKLRAAIRERLLAEAEGVRRDVNRKEVSFDDIDFDNKNTDKVGYTDITKLEFDNPDAMFKLLRDQARISGEAESNSRRVVAVVGPDGEVRLLSTFNDSGTQRIADPSGPKVLGKQFRNLDESFMKQWRPFATLLLKDPVKGLNQSFKSVSEFMDQIGEEASNITKEIGLFSADIPETFSAEGTSGLEGEGGSFMGPGKRAVRAAVGTNRPERLVKGQLEAADLEAVMNHIIDETGKWESPEDVKSSIDAITERATRRKLTPQDWDAIQGYSKVVDKILKRNPDLTEAEAVDLMARELYENQRNKTSDQFIARTMERYSEEVYRPDEPIPEGEAASPTARELTSPTPTRRPERGGGPPLRGITAQAARLARERAEAEARAGAERVTKEVQEAPTEPHPSVEADIRMARLREEAAAEAKAEMEAEGSRPAAIFKRKKIGPVVTDIIRNTGSIYDEWMVDRLKRVGGPVSQQAAEGFKHITDRTKQLYGSLTPLLDPARRAAGGQKSRTIPGVSRVTGPIDLPDRKSMQAAKWLNSRENVTPFAATRRVVDAMEGRRPVPSHVQPVLELSQVANLEIGKMMEPAVAGFIGSGRASTDLIANVKKGYGPEWLEFSKRVASASSKTPKQVRALMFKWQREGNQTQFSPSAVAHIQEQFAKIFPQVAKGFEASGKFARNITAYAYDVIRQGTGDAWVKWTHGLARANKMPVEQVREFFHEWKSELDKPGVDVATIERVNQDFSRKFPNVITDIKVGTQWQPVVHADLFNYLENAAQRSAHIRAFREQFPATTAGRKALSDLTEELRKELGPSRQKDLDAMLRTMQGHPTDSYGSWGALAPTAPIGSAFRTMNNTVGNLMARMVLTGQMFVQPGENIAGSVPVFLGYKNYLRGMARLKQLYPQLEQMGAVNRVMYDFSLDPNAPGRSSFRMAGNAISKVAMEQFLNELQEGAAAATAHVTAERIKAGTLSEWEKRMLPETFRAMDFTKQQAEAMMKGDVELLDQFQRKAAAFLTSGNKAVSESSRIGANRMFNSVFRFQSYPMMKTQQFRRVSSRLAEAWDTGTKAEKRAATEQFSRFLFGNAMQGALTVGITTLFYQGVTGLGIKMNEAADEPLNFMKEAFTATLGGPLYLMMKGGNGKGIAGMGEDALRMIFPYTVLNEMNDAANGLGKYKDQDTFQRIGKFIESKTPGTKAIATGLAMVGLSSEDRALDAAISGFRRWSRDELGFVERDSYLKQDESKKFRMAMKEAIEAMKEGDGEGFNEAYLKAAGLTGQNSKQAKQDVASSFRGRKLLKTPDGKPLTEDQKESLRKRIGFDAYSRIEYYDLMLDEAADGVLLPVMD